MGASPGSGCTFKATAGSAIAEVNDIAFDGPNRTIIPAPNITDVWLKKIQAAIDAGNATFILNFDATDTQQTNFLTELWGSGGSGWKAPGDAATNYTLTLNDKSTDTTVAFDGFVQSAPIQGIGRDGIVTIAANIAISGAITITYGS